MHESKSRALLIGAPSGGLRGVERDIERMGEMLSTWSFECTTCVGPAATREGILQAIQTLANTTTSTTATVLYFAGHGGQYFLGNTHANRPPLTLNYLAPVRERSSPRTRGILHLEIFRLLEGLSSNVTVIFDCGYAVIKPRTSVERVRALPIREVEPRQLPTLDLSWEALLHEQNIKLWQPRHVAVLATKPGAAAFEAEIAGHVSGHFTTQLCASLMTHRHSPQPWTTLIERVRQHIVQRRISSTQEPQVFGGEGQFPFAGPTESHVRPPDASTFISTSFFSSPMGGDTGSGSVPEADEFIAGASRAIESAINGLRDKGISTTHMIDGKPVRIHADGRQEALESLV